MNDCLNRLREGDSSARDELLAFATKRLERLSHSLLRGQFGRIGRWVDTGDVFQNAALRLWRALATTTPESPLHFHRLAARLVRHELIDVARQLYGPRGLAANHETITPGSGGDQPTDPSDATASPVPDPGLAVELAELHALVQGLPEEEQEATDLIFYQGLTQEEAADLLGVDVRTIQLRWQRARRKLGELLTLAD